MRDKCGSELITSVVIWEATLLQNDDVATPARDDDDDDDDELAGCRDTADTASALHGAAATRSLSAMTAPTRRPRCAARRRRARRCRDGADAATWCVAWRGGNETDERHDNAAAATAVRDVDELTNRRDGDGAATDGSARRDDDEPARASK